MIKVYYAKVSPSLEEDAFFAHLGKVEKKRREKLLAISDKKSRTHSLMAGCLLHYALCDRLEISADTRGPFSLSYEKGGKPYLSEYPDIHFNLSHSGEYVCCALGNIPVGVDIQKAAECRRGIAGRFFTDEDNRRLEACGEEERKELFFRMWSIKESYIKLTGRGLAGGLDSFEIDWKAGRVLENGKTAAYFAEQRKIEGYGFCLSTRESNQSIIWEEVVFF